MLGHTFIHAFVPATDQDQTLKACITLSGVLCKQSPGRGHQQNRCSLFPCDEVLRIADRVTEERFDRLKQRLGLQYHAFATSERPVIYGSVPVSCKFAQVLHVNLRDPCLQCAAHDAVMQRPGEKLRENADQVKSHGLQCNGVAGGRATSEPSGSKSRTVRRINLEEWALRKASRRCEMQAQQRAGKPQRSASGNNPPGLRS